MRIAMLNWTAARAGGVETYLHRVIPALEQAGHAVVLVHESSNPVGRARIAGTHAPASAEHLAAWKPDVILNHGLLDPERERSLVRIAPSILFAHSYYGTCIGGAKTFTWPAPVPCDRRLGWGCLLRYYPRRTGGLHPRTLAASWSRQRARQRSFGTYAGIAVFSRHMHAEYVRHGVDPARIGTLPFPVDPPEADGPRASHQPARLLFVGRCDVLKGGATLLRSMDQLARDTTLQVVGDGPARSAWQTEARRFGTRVRFSGWLDDVADAYRGADLVVMPSLWPEPFGQVGLEAGRFAVPTAAFPVGGIPEWLIPDLNGTLAARRADPTALATAISDALDSDRYQRLSRGALDSAAAHTLARHVSALVSDLERVA